jgi:hypothetical protein
MFCNRKAQAATELAILGSLIIIAFTFLINYSEKINRQQSYLQQTFRAALKEAGGARAPDGPRNAASYTQVIFRRMPNVGTPMELGQLQSFNNSSNVLWEDGTSQAENGVTKYELNGDIISLNPGDAPLAGTIESATNNFTNKVNTTIISSNQSAGGNIITTKTLNAQDILQADVSISGRQYPTFTYTLGTDGKYYSNPTSLEQTILNRSRSTQ